MFIFQDWCRVQVFTAVSLTTIIHRFAFLLVMLTYNETAVYGSLSSLARKSMKLVIFYHDSTMNEPSKNFLREMMPMIIVFKAEEPYVHILRCNFDFLYSRG